MPDEGTAGFACFTVAAEKFVQIGRGEAVLFGVVAYCAFDAAARQVWYAVAVMGVDAGFEGVTGCKADVEAVFAVQYGAGKAVVVAGQSYPARQGEVVVVGDGGVGDAFDEFVFFAFVAAFP